MRGVLAWSGYCIHTRGWLALTNLQFTVFERKVVRTLVYRAKEARVHGDTGLMETERRQRVLMSLIP